MIRKFSSISQRFRFACVFGLNGKNFFKTMINVGKIHGEVRVVNGRSVRRFTLTTSLVCSLTCARQINMDITMQQMRNYRKEQMQMVQRSDISPSTIFVWRYIASMDLQRKSFRLRQKSMT